MASKGSKVAETSMPGPRRAGAGTDRSIAPQRSPLCPPQWSKNGQGVLVHTELYEEEMRKNKELFPELADLSCIAALQAWLLAYGFKLKGAK